MMKVRLIIVGEPKPPTFDRDYTWAADMHVA
jgi:hypothetical protein